MQVDKAQQLVSWIPGITEQDRKQVCFDPYITEYMTGRMDLLSYESQPSTKNPDSVQKQCSIKRCHRYGSWFRAVCDCICGHPTIAYGAS